VRNIYGALKSIFSLSDCCDHFLGDLLFIEPNDREPFIMTLPIQTNHMEISRFVVVSNTKFPPFFPYPGSFSKQIVKSATGYCTAEMVLLLLLRTFSFTINQPFIYQIKINYYGISFSKQPGNHATGNH
jgi:hypothetical protein